MIDDDHDDDDRDDDDDDNDDNDDDKHGDGDGDDYDFFDGDDDDDDDDDDDADDDYDFFDGDDDDGDGDGDGDDDDDDDVDDDDDDSSHLTVLTTTVQIYPSFNCIRKLLHQLSVHLWLGPRPTARRSQPRCQEASHSPLRSLLQVVRPADFTFAECQNARCASKSLISLANKNQQNQKEWQNVATVTQRYDLSHSVTLSPK